MRKDHQDLVSEYIPEGSSALGVWWNVVRMIDHRNTRNRLPKSIYNLLTMTGTGGCKYYYNSTIAYNDLFQAVDKL